MRNVGVLLSSGYDALFLKGADSLGAEHHCYFLAINEESLLLKIWLKYALSAT